MIDANPAKVGVDNPTPRRKEQRPFESWAELEAIAAALGPRYGPMIAAARIHQIFPVATEGKPGQLLPIVIRIRHQLARLKPGPVRDPDPPDTALKRGPREPLADG